MCMLALPCMESPASHLFILLDVHGIPELPVFLNVPIFPEQASSKVADSAQHAAGAAGKTVIRSLILLVLFSTIRVLRT